MGIRLSDVELCELEVWRSELVARGCPRFGREPVRLAAALFDEKPLCIDRLQALLESLSEYFADLIDGFGGLERSHSWSHEKRDDCIRFRMVLEVGILVVCARLHGRSPQMRAIHPGKVTLDLIDAALDGCRCEVLDRLFERARLADRSGWDRLLAGFTRFEDRSDAGLRWPDRSDCDRIRADLLAVHGSWTIAVEQATELHSGRQNRVRRRDPAYRRATQWWSLLYDLVDRMAVTRPDLRVLMDYSLAILDRFEARDHRVGGRGIEELMTLDVLSALEYGLTGARELFPVVLEIGGNDRRKRLQRERLHVLLRWRAHASHVQWTSDLLPRIAGLSLRLEGREHATIQPAIPASLARPT